MQKYEVQLARTKELQAENEQMKVRQQEVEEELLRISSELQESKREVRKATHKNPTNNSPP